MNTVLSWIGAAIGGLMVGFGFVLTVGARPITLGIGIVCAVAVALLLFATIYKLIAQLDASAAKAKEDEKQKLLTHEEFTGLEGLTVINPDEFKRTILAAREKLRTIYTYADGILSTSVNSKLKLLIQESHNVIDEIKKDPKDYQLARTWFNTHLDQILDLARQYRTNETKFSPKQTEDFGYTLDEAIRNTIRLKQDLVKNDLNAFSINLEVFSDQLKVENR